MKLVKLIVKNFRGLGGNENIIEFSNSNIIFLIGQNNIGKSTFLRAYEFFVSGKKSCQTDFFNHDISTPIEIEGIFEKEDGDEEEVSNEPDWVNKWVDSEGFIKIKKLWKRADTIFEKYTFSPSENGWVKNGFGGMDSLFIKYSPDVISINAMETEETLETKVNKLIQDEFLKKVETEFSTEYNTALDSIKVLQSKILGKEELDEYNENINKHFKELFSDLSLKITEKNDKIKIEDILKKEHIVSVTKDGQSFSEDIKSNGHGIIRQALFNFLTFLKNEITGTQKKYLILFEEPELYLHPKVIFNLRKSLYKLSDNSPFQILCATHSPMMIDISKEHSSLVRIVKEGTENTKTFQVGDNIFRESDEMKNFVQMINRFNPHICESFYANKVLLLEGDTEAIIFRDLLDRFFPESEIFVLNTGSKNNITFFQKILRHFNIEYIVIHDADTEFIYKSDGSIKENNDGTNAKNSAWKINKNIQDELDLYIGKGIRYVNIKDFETENNYEVNSLGKAVSAYEFVKGLNLDSDKKCIEFLKYIVGEESPSDTYNQEYIENNRYVFPI